MLCKRDFYGQQHSNEMRICNASLNIDLKPSNDGRLLTKQGLQNLEGAGSSTTDRCQGYSTSQPSWEGMPSFCQPANQYLLNASKEKNVVLDPHTSQEISCISFAHCWCSLIVYYFLSFCSLGYYCCYYYFAWPSVFSDCKLGGNYTPFANFSTV